MPAHTSKDQSLVQLITRDKPGVFYGLCVCIHTWVCVCVCVYTLFAFSLLHCPLRKATSSGTHTHKHTCCACVARSYPISSSDRDPPQTSTNMRQNESYFFICFQGILNEERRNLFIHSAYAGKTTLALESLLHVTFFKSAR